MDLVAVEEQMCAVADELTISGDSTLEELGRVIERWADTVRDKNEADQAIKRAVGATKGHR